jgi:hypothetical protein
MIRIVITTSKKMLRACEKHCFKREIERLSHIKQQHVTLPIEDQLSQIMAIPTPASEPAIEKPKPKVPFTTNRSLFCVLQYAFKEPMIDLVFITRACVMYTRMLLQRARDLALRLGKKQVTPKRSPTVKQANQAPQMDDTKIYAKLIKDKVLGLLTTYNSRSFEDVQKYHIDYRSRHPKK